MSFFQKLKAGLSKTKEGMLKNLDGLFGGHKIEEDFYEELEEILIMSDVGAAVSGKIVSQLRAKVKEAGCWDAWTDSLLFYILSTEQRRNTEL